MGKLFVIVVLTVLAGCQTVPLSYEDSPYSLIPTGSKLTLHRDMTVPAGRASLYMQGGRVLPYAELDPYHPHCLLELGTLTDTPQTVKADEFVITKVIYHQYPGLSTRSDILFAGVNVSGIFTADGAGLVTYSTHMQLSSQRQPAVQELNCQHWQDPPLAVHVTIREIRQALGDIFTLHVAGNGA